MNDASLSPALKVVGLCNNPINAIMGIAAFAGVPDDQVSVNANASRIRQIDLSQPDYFIASDNIFTVAQDSGWWNPKQRAFEFCYAYDPDGRTALAARRREWRVFDLLAPALKLNPESENYPFSGKPDTPVTMPKLVSIFHQTVLHRIFLASARRLQKRCRS